jgi:hypothetical protein
MCGRPQGPDQCNTRSARSRHKSGFITQSESASSGTRSCGVDVQVAASARPAQHARCQKQTRELTPRPEGVSMEGAAALTVAALICRQTHGTDLRSPHSASNRHQSWHLRPERVNIDATAAEAALTCERLEGGPDSPSHAVLETSARDDSWPSEASSTRQPHQRRRQAGGHTGPTCEAQTTSEIDPG